MAIHVKISTPSSMPTWPCGSSLQQTVGSPSYTMQCVFNGYELCGQLSECFVSWRNTSAQWKGWEQPFVETDIFFCTGHFHLPHPLFCSCRICHWKSHDWRHSWCFSIDWWRQEEATKTTATRWSKGQEGWCLSASLSALHFIAWMHLNPDASLWDAEDITNSVKVRPKGFW